MSVILTNEYMDPARVIFGVVLGLHVSGLRFLGAVPWGSGPEMGSKKALPETGPFSSPFGARSPRYGTARLVPVPLPRSGGSRACPTQLWPVGSLREGGGKRKQG